jgi:hypothetical protein
MTQSANVAALYSDVVASLVPYYEDQVLLPNAQFMRNVYDITGSSGTQIKIPVVNAYVDGQTITEGANISDTAAAENDFEPASVTLAMAKRGSWTDITEEAIEDGGIGLVRQQVLARLSGAIAQATDKAGFAELAGAGGTDYGVTTANVVCERNIVMGPDSLAYGVKREPTVNVWFNPDNDTHEFRGTIRNGFKTIATNRIAMVSGSNTIASASNVATLAQMQEAVANLRAANVPTMDGSMYAAFIGPATEYALVSELNNVGASQLGSLSDVGNQALLTALLGSAVGAMFYRTNNLTVETNS